MHLISKLPLLLALISVATANPVVTPSTVILEQRKSIPDGFVSNGPADPNTTLDLVIGLAANNIIGLEKALYDSSTPGSPLYGQHLSKEEVESFAMPSPDTTSKVNVWLAAKGITPTVITPAGDWISLSITVSQANGLLNTDFQAFTDTSTNTATIRTLDYSVPEDLKDCIDTIHPTTTFPVNLALPITVSSPITQGMNLTSGGVPPSCQNQITPQCLEALYGIPTAKATQSSNTLGVPGFIGQYANRADLKTFLTKYRPDLASSTTFSLQTLDGGQDPQTPLQAGTEANLDIQYTIGLASGVPTTFISVGKNNQDGVSGFLDLVNFLLRQPNPPQVITISYGFNENALSSNVAKKLCNAYMQLTARGVSVLFASGDGGVGGSRPSNSCTTFVPTFPSTCPYITSVGATTSFGPEIAANLSSGGFSNYFSRPSYQDSAVSTYLNNLGSTNSGKFNKTGRAFPDVSAQGQKVAIIVGGQSGLVAGTSCSSPIFASVISLLNDALISSGKPPLGFLNPLLYSSASSGALTDVVKGSNPGCNTPGFPASPGWDPVTGLGTPNFAKLKTAIGL